ERTSTRFISTDEGLSEHFGGPPADPGQAAPSPGSSEGKPVPPPQKPYFQFVCLLVMLFVVTAVIIYFALFAGVKQTTQNTTTTRKPQDEKESTAALELGSQPLFLQDFTRSPARRRFARFLDRGSRPDWMTPEREYDTASGISRETLACPSTQTELDRLSFEVKTDLSSLRRTVAQRTCRIKTHLKINVLVSFPCDVIMAKPFNEAYVAMVLDGFPTNLTFLYVLSGYRNQEIRMASTAIGNIPEFRRRLMKTAGQSRIVGHFNCSRAPFPSWGRSINVTQFQVKADLSFCFSKLSWKTCNATGEACTESFHDWVREHEFKQLPDFRMLAVSTWYGKKYPHFRLLKFIDVSTSCEIEVH
ncbi:hypothetical protein BIW11_10458, partial [Tropilaelaps mercedesae]